VASQSRTVPSKEEADAGEKATALTESPWPLSVCFQAPVEASHSWTVSSIEADARTFPSGEIKATASKPPNPVLSIDISPAIKEMLPIHPTVEEMETWNEEKVLQWIMERKPDLLKGNNFKFFNEADIAGEAFLLSSRDFFRKCGVSPGPSLVLESFVNQVKALKQGKLLHTIFNLGKH
jgi:hypothetical protein